MVNLLLVGPPCERQFGRKRLFWIIVIVSIFSSMTHLGFGASNGGGDRSITMLLTREDKDETRQHKITQDKTDARQHHTRQEDKRKQDRQKRTKDQRQDKTRHQDKRKTRKSQDKTKTREGKDKARKRQRESKSSHNPITHFP